MAKMLDRARCSKRDNTMLEAPQNPLPCPMVPTCCHCWPLRAPWLYFIHQLFKIRYGVKVASPRMVTAIRWRQRVAANTPVLLSEKTPTDIHISTLKFAATHRVKFSFDKDPSRTPSGKTLSSVPELPLEMAKIKPLLKSKEKPPK